MISSDLDSLENSLVNIQRKPMHQLLTDTCIIRYVTRTMTTRRRYLCWYDHFNVHKSNGTLVYQIVFALTGFYLRIISLRQLHVPTTNNRNMNRQSKKMDGMTQMTCLELDIWCKTVHGSELTWYWNSIHLFQTIPRGAYISSQFDNTQAQHFRSRE